MSMHEIFEAVIQLQELYLGMSTIKEDEEGREILLREYNRGIKDMEIFIKKEAKRMKLNKKDIKHLLKEARTIRMDFVSLINLKRQTGQDFKKELKWLEFINDSTDFLRNLEE